MIAKNLATTLQNKRKYEYEFIHEKDPNKKKMIPLTLGKSQLEYERGNCGIFLYWHGRLIEVSPSSDANHSFLCPFNADALSGEKSFLKS